MSRQLFKAELKAMAREWAKDTRATIMEAYSGKPEHGSEMGTPLNPVNMEIYEERHQDGPKQETDMVAEARERLQEQAREAQQQQKSGPDVGR